MKAKKNQESNGLTAVEFTAHNGSTFVGIGITPNFCIAATPDHRERRQFGVIVSTPQQPLPTFENCFIFGIKSELDSKEFNSETGEMYPVYDWVVMGSMSYENKIALIGQGTSVLFLSPHIAGVTILTIMESWSMAHWRK